MIFLSVLSLLVLGCLVPGDIRFSLGAVIAWALFLLLRERRVFRRLGGWKFWMVTVLLTGLSGFLIGKTDFHLWGVPLSSRGVAAGLNMLCRGFVIFSLVVFWTGKVDRDKLVAFFDRVGLRQLGVSLGYALAAIPTLQARFEAKMNHEKKRGIGKLLSFWEEVLQETVQLAEAYSMEQKESKDD